MPLRAPLRTISVPGEQIETLMGHRTLKRTTAVYAKYDPDYLGIARHALAKLFTDVTAAADEWSAGHLRAKVGNGLTIVTKRETAKTVDEHEKTSSRGG